MSEPVKRSPFRHTRFMSHAEVGPLDATAFDAMSALIEKRGLGAAENVYAQAAYRELEERWAKSRNLKRSTGKICVQRLLGKRCMEYYPHGDCRCHIPRADHMSLWMRDGVPIAYVSQPYGLTTRSLTETLTFCEKYGLDVQIDASPAWHYPHVVLMVVITKAGVHL